MLAAALRDASQSGHVLCPVSPSALAKLVHGHRLSEDLPLAVSLLLAGWGHSKPCGTSPPWILSD